MIYILTTVVDRLTGSKGLTLELNNEAAKRSFVQAVKNPESLVHASKGDFELVALGTYDTDLPCLKPYDKPIVLIRGSDINV